jgi:hypothetical protein
MALRASPGSWGLARGLPEVLAQVGLVGEAARKRYVTQRCISPQHVLSGQFHATPHQESVRRLPKGALEGAGEVRFAALNERAKIHDQYRPCDMTINIVKHLASRSAVFEGPVIVTQLQIRWSRCLSKKRRDGSDDHQENKPA